MVVIRTVVFREFVGDAIEGEAAMGDAAGVAAKGGTEVGFLFGCAVGIDGIMAEHNICEEAGPIRNLEGGDARAIGGKADFHASGILQR